MGSPQPFLGATVLQNDGTVGTKYGMWWYRDKTGGAFKQVAGWFVPIPASAQADLQGCTIGLGSPPRSQAMSPFPGGHFGTGLHCFKALPPTSNAPGTVIPLGRRLMDYSAESPNRGAN